MRTPDTILYEEIDEFDGRPRCKLSGFTERLCQHDTTLSSSTRLSTECQTRTFPRCKLSGFTELSRLVAIQDGNKTKRLKLFARTAPTLQLPL